MFSEYRLDGQDLFSHGRSIFTKHRPLYKGLSKSEFSDKRRPINERGPLKPVLAQLVRLVGTNPYKLRALE